MGKMTVYRYRREVFKTALLEAMGKLHVEILNGDGQIEEADADMVKKFSDAFYADELELDKSSVDDIKSRLAEASEFIRDVVDTCEHIADDKADAVKDGTIELDDKQEVELSEEDKAVLDQIFDVKKPTEDLEAIRDATVAALVAEDKKAQEIKDTLDIAQSQVASGENPDALEETVARINKIGPTSLMNGIMNHFSTLAVKDINENGNFTSVSDAMRKNRDIIKDRAVIMYSLFETANRLGIHKYQPAEIKQLTYEFYYGR